MKNTTAITIDNYLHNIKTNTSISRRKKSTVYEKSPTHELTEIFKIKSAQIHHFSYSYF